jgi:5-methyltetrahydrofolate--homocysteine methyltransferase
MKPPFLGTRKILDIGIKDLIGLIDREILFASRWQFRQAQTGEEREKQKREILMPVFDRISGICLKKNILEPRIIYGYFECRRQENAVLVTPAQGSKINKTQRFEFPRRRQEPHLCVADFFPDGFITMQLVTVGDRVIKEGARLFGENKYADAFYLKGFAAQAAEAAAEYAYRHIKKELNVPPEQGCRVSFGYPAAPNLMDQKKLYALLDGAQIGVKLTETYQLVPEYSTSAVVCVSPQSKIFRP